MGKGDVLAVPGWVADPVGRCKMLGKRAGAMAEAATVQEKITWLDSGATEILNLHKKINARNGPCHRGLQKTCGKKLSLKLDCFWDETPGGDWQAICSLEKGIRWLAVLFVWHSTQCCSSVNQVFVTR
jgi:hypothetical protein